MTFSHEFRTFFSCILLLLLLYHKPNHKLMYFTHKYLLLAFSESYYKQYIFEALMGANHT